MKLHAKCAPGLPVDEFDGTVCGTNPVARYLILNNSYEEFEERLQTIKGKPKSIVYINEVVWRVSNTFGVIDSKRGLKGLDDLKKRIDRVREMLPGWEVWICDHSIQDPNRFDYLVYLAGLFNLDGIGINLHVDLNPFNPDRKGIWRLAAWNLPEYFKMGMMSLLRAWVEIIQSKNLKCALTELSVFGPGNQEKYLEILNLANETGCEFVCFWNAAPDYESYPNGGAWHWVGGHDGSESLLYSAEGMWRMSWTLEEVRNSNPSK